QRGGQKSPSPLVGRWPEGRGGLRAGVPPPRPPGRPAAKRRGGQNAYPFRAATALFFATLAGIFRVTSSARLMSAAGAFTRQFPGTTTYPPILCPATGSKSRPPCFLTASISAGGSRRTSSSP